MRLVFIGASRFGLQCLDVAIQITGIEIAGVVTAPETFSISYRPNGVKNVLHANIYQFAKERGMQVVVIDKGMGAPDLLELVRQWRPEAFLVAGWYHMIPRGWREVAPAYGLHASLLPDYSGGAPLVWAMINGEERTGITLFRMDDGVDSGPIIGQLAEPIHAHDTIATLYERITERGLQLLRQSLPVITADQPVLKVQDENLRRIFPQRGPEDGKINWKQSAVEIDRFVRAQTRPYPGAFSTLGKQKWSIWRAEVIDSSIADEVPGRILPFDSGYVVTTSRGELRLMEISCGELIYRESELAGLLGSGELRFNFD